MPTSLGAHNPRVDFARELLSKKGRREHARFSFEGPTLLHEALAAGVDVEYVYVTSRAYEATQVVREAESRGVPIYTVDERTMQKISDVETPAGILAVAPIKLERPVALLQSPGLVLALADVSDPGNAGTLLRTAEAFGIDRAVFGSAGADPFLPKVVRSAMGAVFRLRLAQCTPEELATSLDGWEVTGLLAGGEPLGGLAWSRKSLLLVGNERRGIGPWDTLCTRFAAIEMHGAAESLNAAVAGAIAMYEATKRMDS